MRQRIGLSCKMLRNTVFSKNSLKYTYQVYLSIAAIWKKGTFYFHSLKQYGKKSEQCVGKKC